jgi:hypothetical protein
MHIWAPLFVHLAMTFRDINQMFYFAKHPKNDKQKAIKNFMLVELKSNK